MHCGERAFVIDVYMAWWIAGIRFNQVSCRDSSSNSSEEAKYSSAFFNRQKCRKNTWRHRMKLKLSSEMRNLTLQLLHAWLFFDGCACHRVYHWIELQSFKWFKRLFSKLRPYAKYGWKYQKSSSLLTHHQLGRWLENGIEAPMRLKLNWFEIGCLVNCQICSRILLARM